MSKLNQWGSIKALFFERKNIKIELYFEHVVYSWLYYSVENNQSLNFF